MPTSTLPTVRPFDLPNGPKMGAEIHNVDLNNLTGATSEARPKRSDH